MEDFEQEQLSKFYSAFIDDYIEHLENENAIDFDINKKPDPDKIPISAYTSYIYSLEKILGNTDDASCYFSIILRDAYLYAGLKKDENNNRIINFIENNDLNTMESYLKDDKLLFIAIIKNFIQFLFLINEDMAFKDIAIDEVNKKGKENVLEKLNKKESLKTINYYLRKQLVKYYIELNEDGTPDKDIFIILDRYFFDGCEIEFNFQNISSLENFNGDYVRDEQIKLIYETVLLALINDTEDISSKEQIVAFIYDHQEDKPLCLPEDKKIRWNLYSLFFQNSIISKDSLAKVSSYNRGVLKKMCPSYFLDFLD